MMAEQKMRVVDGVRYRPEDAPESQQQSQPQQSEKSTGEAQHKARRPARSARSGEHTDSE